MAVAGAHAVAAGVATADDDDVLAIGPQLALQLVARVDFVLLGQELHGEVHAFELAARDGQVAGILSATGEQDGIEVGLQLRRAERDLGVVGDLGLGR